MADPYQAAPSPVTPDPPGQEISPEDAAILSLFDPIVRDWWLASFPGAESLFTPPQRQAVPLIGQGKNVLICSPTGSGKTLSAFISIINQLLVMAAKGELENSVYCLYISPLKSLANDIHKNLERPLQEMQALAGQRGIEVQEIRHAIRHGDVSAQEKARMLKKTPHILNTTPESLAILLSSPRFREKLKTVRWVIVDEIHSLAASKRGVHLSLSLERLEELKREPHSAIDPVDPASGSFTRIGCSATVEPLLEVADFLAGNFRPVQVVDSRFSRRFDLRLLCPVPDLIVAGQKELADRLYELLHRLIQDHRSTLIFTNSRNGAERVLSSLVERFPQLYNAGNSACHHGSMGREGRLDTESRLKQGRLKVVCSSSSLELGIDMPYIDLVLQIGSPKSVSSLLQRFGRGGHSLDQVVLGRIIALNREELMECAVMLERAKAGAVDRIHIPRNALDALCQHLLGMALERDWTIDEVLRVVHRSYCYTSLCEEELMSAVLYLSATHEGMQERYIYPKIRYDPQTRMITKLGGSSRMIYYTNSGMIPDQFTCDVFTREGRWVGKLDERYMEKLEKEDVFSIGGRSYSFCYRRGGKIYVDSSAGRANIPTWSSERLPLSFDLARSILSFRSDMLWMIKSHVGQEGREGWVEKEEQERKDDQAGRDGQEDQNGWAAVKRWLKQQYPIDENSARSICQIFRQQIAFLGEDGVSTNGRIVVQESLDPETGRRIYYILSGYGLRFNEGFSRMVAYLLARQRMDDICITTADSGFALSLPASGKVNLPAIIRSIREENCELLLYRALQKTSLLKSVFRINATRSFMILKSYKGRKKSARHQQFDADMLIGFAGSLDGFAVMQESFREIIEDRFEVENIKEVLRGLASGEIEVVIKAASSPSPMAFELAAAGAWERQERQREMHRRVLEKIGGVESEEIEFR
ncbi:MAG: ATP-dependent helicase [Methanotrichaceae archaeon]|nr:ATP-dependent helicase [Methanotrichaceae archaeon]